MQIQQAQAYALVGKNNKPQFKSVYPVKVWVREMGGGYAPVATKELTKTLTTKIVNILNKSGAEIASKLKELEDMQLCGESKCSTEINKTRLKIAGWIKSFIAKYDADYAQQNKNFYDKPHTRAFYTEGGEYKGYFNPCAYLITGYEACQFNSNFGKPIGLSKRLSRNVKTAELNMAKTNYWKKGLTYVKNRSKNFTINGVPMELHVKMETVRAKSGNIKGYNIIGIGYFPQTGPKNPINLTEWLNNGK